VFAKILYKSGLMDERDYKTYVSLFQNMSNFMRKPNVIVHLDVSPQESLRRIQSRSRGSFVSLCFVLIRSYAGMESSIPLGYLENLNAGYEEFIQDISKVIPVIRVNWESFRTAEEMAIKIHEVFDSLHIIKHVQWQ
jgi:deoxyadenosine kinase